MHAEYTDQLNHPDPFERVAALEALGAGDDARALAAAAGRLLADEDPGVRETAARMLIHLGTPDAARAVCPYIASPRIDVRNLAGEVLMQIGAPAVDALAAAIDDPDKDIRKFAIDVLAHLPAQPLAHRIAAHLNDDDANVRLAAIDALAALGAYEHAASLLALYDQEPLARPSIVAALGAFGDRTDLAFFGTALSDENPVVQFAAAEALAHYAAPTVLDLLLDKVHVVAPMARPVVLSSLVNLLDAHPDRVTDVPPDLKPFLVEMLSDIDPDFTLAAIRGLRLMDAAGTLHAVLDQAGRSDAVDVEIFNTLLVLPNPLDHLAQAASGGTLSPELSAQFLLGLLVQEALSPAQLPEAETFLLDYYEHLDADTKIAAISLGQRIGLAGILQAGIADPDPTVHTIAADAARDAGHAPV